MRILVIVVTYNGLKWLDRCLGSVRASEVPADLYVWDNDSADGSADFVAAHFPEAKLTRSADNLGFAEANNMGVRYALEKGYDYVYLLNQDAWIEPSTLGTLVSFSEAHPEYGVLSPLQMTDGFAALDKQFALVSRKLPLRRVMAAHWLVPCRVLEKVGGVLGPVPDFMEMTTTRCDRARLSRVRRSASFRTARAVHDREYRVEPKEKVIYRNYYMGSLVRLCDVNRPLWERFLYVCLFTIVKAVKYGSVLPFKHFRALVGMLPEIRKTRANSI
jgi:Predicted glycosyltransferases